MNYEGLISDKLAVVEVIQPQVVTAGATGVLTGAINMANFSKVIAILQTGTLGTAGTLDFQAVASATSGGTYTAVTGKAATQLVKATNDNDLVVVEVSADDVAKVSKQYVKFHAVAGTADATCGCVVLGVPRNYTADLVDNANIVQYVS